MTRGRRRADNERELSYLLLVELLAFQFASPVKWIETQDVLLVEKEIRRIIEIGPSDTLVAMARKTLAAKYEIRDAARSISRDLLCYSHDQASILYTGTSELATDADRSKAKTSTTCGGQITKPAITQASAPASISPNPSAAVIANKIGSSEITGGVVEAQIATEIVDVPMKAKDVVLALAAQKLKRSLADITTSKSIKQLAGGRSTLENEIVGDLSTEFGSLPERPEDLELGDLCDRIESSSYSGQLGQVSSAHIGRFMSSKMPGGYGVNQTREYLTRRWGLGPGRQDAVLVRAISEPPASRLTNQIEAHTFLDGVVNQYVAEHNITANFSMTLETVAERGTVATVDPHALVVATKQEKAYRLAEFQLRAQQLGVDLRAGERHRDELQSSVAHLRTEVDFLNEELGESFLSGIRSAWSPRQIRKYESCWNWVLQDIMIDFFNILLGLSTFNDSNIRQRCLLSANRTNPRLLQVLRSLSSRLSSSHSESIDTAKAYIAYLKATCKRSNTHVRLGPYVLDRDLFDAAPQTEISTDGQVICSQIQRTTFTRHPIYTLKTKNYVGDWIVDPKMSNEYDELVKQLDQSQITFTGKNVLLVGAGRDSIGAEILRGLLIGGARVMVTTSSFSSTTAAYYQEMFQNYGCTGSQLILIPFNQASQQDIEFLVSYIYDSSKGLGIDLDHVLPFAAVSQTGKDIGDIDSKAELVQRMLLTNVIRLLGAIKKRKHMLGYDTRVTQIILPLSPNHGNFGYDGLYAESKLALETLFHKWSSEDWSPYLSICGANIGWTRGTGLMKENDLVAAGIERHGMRTFSQTEMAYYILVLMSRQIADCNDTVPIYADFTGGLSTIPDLAKLLATTRAEVIERSEIARALALELEFDNTVSIKPTLDELVPVIVPRANIDIGFPHIPENTQELQQLRSRLRGMIDLDRIIVVTGFSELGPYGNSRTRWEMEALGRFSLEGCVEMAWIMGMIKAHNGPIDGKHYTGWVDAKTGKPIQDIDVKSKYEQKILDHSGIRFVEPELDIGWGADPTKRQLLQEIILTEDLPPMMTSRETAQQFKSEHGLNVDVYDVDNSTDEMHVQFKKGAALMIPKALQQAHPVAGQIPTGWDPRTYGISDDIISQVDRVTLFALVNVAEALLSSGITDSYELYQYIHVSQLGNCIGSGFGGVHALKSIFRRRFHDQVVQNDILQETFINTTAAWVNMLLLSAAGPLRTPVGACATALESLDSGVDMISSGRAKICLVGAVDDLDQDINVEFGNMRATVNAADELAKGRSPREMSRPTAASRGGFVEAHGSGIQVLTSARLALDMGLPIHGIIAWVSTSSDKASRSVPAPGQGVLTNASERKTRFPSPLLDIVYRRRRLQQRTREIKEAHAVELQFLRSEMSQASRWNFADRGGTLEDISQRQQWLELDAERQLKEALGTYGHRFWEGNPEIAPIRGALAVWGLTIDDLDFASFHGTSTIKNDLNETNVIQQQLVHLGRRPGNPVYGVFQKWLTGHSKGAAGAWMLNGCLQVLNTGLVPGNRNADDIDPALEAHDHIFYPTKSIQTVGLKAFSITSFGFGQKGAQAIGIHPRYLFASIGEEELESYTAKAKARQRKAYTFFHRGMATNSLFKAKAAPPYTPKFEAATLLDPTSRAARGVDEEFSFDGHR